MNPAIRREYFRLRHKEWRASDAWRAAIVLEAFEALADEELVRFETHVDEHNSVDDLCGDCDDRDEIIERANRDGVWGICGEYFHQGAWVPADSVWGFIGDDYRDSGYDTDVRLLTIEALLAARRPSFCQSGSCTAACVPS